MFKREIRGPIAALVLLSLGGFLLHVRIHPPAQSVFNWLPAVVTGFNVLVLPFLFSSARTVAWAYLFNALTVVVGTVAMAWWSATTWDPAAVPLTALNLVLRSTLPDIAILAARLPIGHTILRHFRPLPLARRGRAAP